MRGESTPARASSTKRTDLSSSSATGRRRRCSPSRMKATGSRISGAAASARLDVRPRSAFAATPRNVWRPRLLRDQRRDVQRRPQRPTGASTSQTLPPTSPPHTTCTLHHPPGPRRTSCAPRARARTSPGSRHTHTRARASGWHTHTHEWRAMLVERTRNRAAGGAGRARRPPSRHAAERGCAKGGGGAKGGSGGGAAQRRLRRRRRVRHCSRDVDAKIDVTGPTSASVPQAQYLGALKLVAHALLAFARSRARGGPPRSCGRRGA